MGSINVMDALDKEIICVLHGILHGTWLYHIIYLGIQFKSYDLFIIEIPKL